MFATTPIKPSDPIRDQAKNITGFLIHLFWFVAINILIYILDYRDNGVINYAFWVSFGWGIGLVSHAFGIFFAAGIEEAVYNRIKK